MMREHRLALLPRDGLFCKDGRGWHTSESGRGHGLDWPWPSTLRSALLTAWGRLEEGKKKKANSKNDWLAHKQGNHVVLQELLALRRPHGEAAWKQEHRVWPAPADALWLEGRDKVAQLRPKPLDVPTMGIDDKADAALWWPAPPEKAKPRKAPRWLEEQDFVAWLCGKEIEARRLEDYPAPQKRMQEHVGIEPETLAHKESVLFRHDILEFLEPGHEWAIGARVGVMETTGLPADKTPSLATIGSDSRLARALATLPEEVFAPPEKLLDAFGEGGVRGLRLVVVTPAKFKEGWLPDGFDFVEANRQIVGAIEGLEDRLGALILRAAFVPRPTHISGWDVAEGKPKSTDRMVPQGAVYFLERADGKPFTRDDAQVLWLLAWGDRQEEGFGRVVPGVWNCGEEEG